MVDEQLIADGTLDAWQEIARRDDWHTRLVGSDIRMLIGDLKRARHRLSHTDQPVGNLDALVAPYVESYEFRFDDESACAPSRIEKAMLEDALHGFIAEHVSAMRAPVGWKLVPVEATPEMSIEGFRRGGGASSTDAAVIWSAMLSAAPASPAVGGDVGCKEQLTPDDPGSWVDVDRARAIRADEAEKRDDIRRGIIRQLGDDPHSDRIILAPTDWDIVLAALGANK